MVFKVDYNRVNDIGKNLGNDNEILAKKFEELLKIIEDLNKYWYGDDYDKFKDNTYDYIMDLNDTIENINFVSTVMKKASEKYRNNDIGWLKNVKKIGADEIEKYNC